MYKGFEGEEYSKSESRITRKIEQGKGMPSSREIISESVAAVLMDMARHSFKGKTPEGREPLTEKGVVEAVKVGAERKGGTGLAAKKKLGRGEAVSVYGSPRERTQQSSLFRQFGEVFKDASFTNVDPQDVLRWLEEGGAVKAEGSPLLDFQVGEGEYSKEAIEAFGRNEWMKWLVERSDKAAVETKQDPEGVSTLSIQAANVAAYIYAMGIMKAKEILKDEKAAAKYNDLILLEQAYITSHQGVTESFLYKVIKMEDKDPEAAEKFLAEDLNNQGFKENEGFRVGFFALDKNDPHNFKVIVSWKGKEYTLDPEDLEKIMQEGSDLKAKIAAAKKD